MDQSLGNHKFLQKISTSAISQTWLTQYGDQKWVLKHTERYPRSQRQIDEEREIKSKIQHQNIIQYTNGIEQIIEGKRCLTVATRYCHEGDFTKVVSEKSRLSAKVKLLMDVAQALVVLHSHNIIHGNIKLQNLFRAEGKGKLGDFGLSKILRTDQSRFIYAGSSLLYLSPQIYNGKSYDKNADIWAFGVVMLEVILGLRLSGFNPEGQAIPLKPLCEYPELLGELVDKSMAKNQKLGLLLKSIFYSENQTMKDILEQLTSIDSLFKSKRGCRAVNLNLEKKQKYSLDPEELLVYESTKKDLQNTQDSLEECIMSSGGQVELEWVKETDEVTFRNAHLKKISLGYQNLPKIVRLRCSSMRNFLEEMLAQSSQYYLNEMGIFSFKMECLQEESDNSDESDDDFDWRAEAKNKIGSKSTITHNVSPSNSQISHPVELPIVMKQRMASDFDRKQPKSEPESSVSHMQNLSYQISRLKEKSPADYGQIGKNYYQLSLIYFNDERYKEAKEECRKALESLRQTKYMGSYMVKIHYTIGLCEVKIKDHQAARENFEKAKEILENIKRKRQVDEEDQLKLVIAMADLCLVEGDSEMAQVWLMEISQLWQHSSKAHQYLLARVSCTRGDVYSYLKDPQQAVVQYNNALTLMGSSTKDVIQQIQVRSKLVSCYFITKDYDKMVIQMQISFAILQEANLIQDKRSQSYRDRAVNLIASIIIDVDESIQKRMAKIIRNLFRFMPKIKNVLDLVEDVQKK